MEHDDTVTVLTSALSRKQFPINEWRQHEKEPSQQVRHLPFYGLVPKDPIEQLRWRLYVRQRLATDDLEFQRAIKTACEQDILFAVNTIYWIFEPRPFGRVLPFNTWADQDDYFVWLKECIDQGRDFQGEKCRGIGWSWLACTACYHDLRNTPWALGAMVSRKEELVDDQKNPGSLFWKLDFLHKWMPECFRLNDDGKNVLERKLMNFSLTDNGSLCQGVEAGPNALTGDRRRWILHDEAAKFPRNAQELLNSTQHVTNCRIIISTYYRGTTTRFFQMMRKEHNSGLKVGGYWKNNPERSKGLYTFTDGQLVKLDPDYDYPSDYDFVDIKVRPEKMGGKDRSPWYDAECARAGATKRSIAEEVDCDPFSVGQKLLEIDLFDKMKKSTKEPRHQGFIVSKEGERKVWSFVHSERSELLVWNDINPWGQLPSGGPYTLGNDLGSGRGTSGTNYSSCVGIDESTGEQFLEFSSSQLRPDAFADFVFGVGKWLCGTMGPSHCKVNFEANGEYGITFWERLMALGWTNWFQEQSVLTGVAERKIKQGYYNSDGNRRILIELQRAALMEELRIKSKRIAGELEQYEEDEQGKIFHAGSPLSMVRSGKGHGDSAVACAIAWMAVSHRERRASQPLAKPVPRTSIAARLLDAQQSEQERGLDDWLEGVDTADQQNPLLALIESQRRDWQYEQ